MPKGTLRYVRVFEFLDFFIRELQVHGTYGFVFKILRNNKLPELLPSNSVKFARDVVPTIGAETPRHRDVISDCIVLIRMQSLPSLANTQARATWAILAP